ncbi:DNA polymerase IV [Ktedonobacter sp. SOSP1-52]|uniref:DNA polymerase IV n=1 Tax=Ktedonobacter sp. SOSP1-52 TaxID=2778366 RepID=UPI00191592E3|nr:DNA polymerase IV [Ktedonobacter sp. SOSP1-52]GHO70238.1 DNA polymerase IV [Ktedonobacter sp. SOSP1-52]
MPHPGRKIIHIDMDAFYASIEQRDRPELRGKPVIVGGDPNRRGVVATCSYEARRFGIHSAMPSRTAFKRCPHAIFVPPRFEVYRAVSTQIMQIFHDYTELVEPLSLDEAFLDVTHNKFNIPSATHVAREIKQRIYERTQLTASAGVSYNKFIAKLASDYKKPDGLTVITPQQASRFLESLPIQKFFGIGRVTASRFQEYGIHTGADLKSLSEERLRELFQERGSMFYHYVRGEDERSVEPIRVRKSVGKETTLAEDLALSEHAEVIRILTDLAEKVERRLVELDLQAKTVVLKLRWSDFQLMTRRATLPQAFQAKEAMLHHIQDLLDQVGPQGHVRLLGVTVSQLEKRGTPAHHTPTLWDLA